MTKLRAAECDVVDQLARRAYGSEQGGATEALLEANPGLAAEGPLLPAGRAVDLPARPAPSPRKPLRLWS